MSEAESSDWTLKICLSGSVIFLGFITWNLGREPRVGKPGMAMLFLVLGLGIFGFIFKDVLIEYLMVSEQAEPYEKAVRRLSQTASTVNT